MNKVSEIVSLKLNEIDVLNRIYSLLKFDISKQLTSKSIAKLIAKELWNNINYVINEIKKKNILCFSYLFASLVEISDDKLWHLKFRLATIFAMKDDCYKTFSWSWSCNVSESCLNDTINEDQNW